MDFELTENQQAIAALARQVFEGTAPSGDGGPAPRRRTWPELARTDLLAVALPEPAGGLGGGMVELCALLVEAGRVASDVPVLPTLVLGALPLGAAGERWTPLLAEVASGTALLTGALADSPAPGEAVTARRDGGGWALRGAKIGVACADRAARVVVAARREDGSGLLAAVDPATVALEPQETTTGEVEFRVALDVAVPEADVVGDDIGWLADRAAVGLCAYQLGLVEAAVAQAAAYVSERVQFGRPIGSFQAVQHRLADAHIDVAAMRWTMWQAAWTLDAGLPAGRAVAAARFWAAHGGQRALTGTLHVHGGLGVDVTYPIHRHFLRGKRVELALGGATASLVALGEELVRA